MRTINNAAGTKNASAVHYHFGSKVGIIEAIVAFIRAELDTSRLDALTALGTTCRNGDRPYTRNHVGRVHAVRPALQHTGLRRERVRFLARLQIDMSPEIQDVLNRDHAVIAHRFDALLARALPELPDQIRRTRYLYFWTLTVQMFAGSEQLASTMFGDLRTCVDEEGCNAASTTSSAAWKAASRTAAAYSELTVWPPSTTTIEPVM